MPSLSKSIKVVRILSGILHPTPQRSSVRGKYRCIAFALCLPLTSGPTFQARTRFVPLVAQEGIVSTSALQREQEERTLEPGKAIERELSRGVIHVYKVALTSDQCLHVLVEQRGVDVMVALRGPDGAPLMEMDGLRGIAGIEELSWEAANTGWYVLEVHAKSQATNSSRYEVRVQKAGAATVKDLARIAAQRLFMEAVRAEAEAQRAGFELAVKRYGEAAEQWRAAGDQKWEGQTLHNLGSIYQRLSQHEKAREHYEQALAIRREIKDRSGEGTTLNGLGIIYSNQNQYEKAQGFYEQSLTIAREIKNRDDEGSALHNLGNIYRNLSQSEKARSYYEQALTIRRETGNREGSAGIINSLGNTHLGMNQYERAREYYEQALIIRREFKDKNGVGQALHNLGLVYRNLNQNEKARVHFEQALEIWRETSNRQGQGQVLSNLGVLHRNLNQNEKARDYYEQSLAIMREIKDRSGEGVALNNLGELYHSLGQSEKAREHYEQSLSIMRQIKNTYREGQVLNNLGGVYIKLGQNEKARDYYEQSLAISRAIGNRYGVGQVLNNLGKVYWRLGQHEQAREHFERSLAIWRELKNREGEGYALDNLGSAYRLLSQPEKAREHFEQALKIRRWFGERSAVAETLLGLATLDRDLGNLADALPRIESALAIIEGLRTTYTDQELRSVYFSTVKNYYEFSIDLLMRLHRQHPSARHDAAALQVNERSRARSLIDLLTEAGADIREGIDPKLVESERSLQQQLNLKAQLQLKLRSRPHSEDEASTAASEIEELTTEYQKLQARIRQNSPRYATLMQPVSLGVKEIQPLLDSDTLLLEYALGPERSYLWAVSRTAMTSYELPKRAEIESVARRVYESFSTGNGTAHPGYAEEAIALSRMLLGPVATQLEKKRLLVVGDSFLQYLPFAALPIPRIASATSVGSGGRKARRHTITDPLLPLISEHEVVSLPSASLLAVLRQELSGRIQAPKMIAMLADPVFDPADTRVKLKIGRPALEVGNRENSLQHSLPPALELPPELERSAIDTGGLSFVRLRSSRDEAEEILALTRGDDSLRAIDFKASRATALGDEIGQYRIVHFATHGLLNSRHPELSGLVLSLVDEHGRPQDGFLRSHDVYNLRLGADLVVLSACQTALGKEVVGEGLVGLTRGFMYAGSPRIVASLWRVPSKATAYLMKRFYQGMLLDGLRPAAALRAAQVAMWKDKRWSEPYYWAAFVLQGEWR